MNIRICGLPRYEYLKDDIDAAVLTSFIEKSGAPVETFIRTKEADYKALGLNSKSLTAAAFARLAVKYPKLLQRPIVIKGGKVVLGQPVEKIMLCWIHDFGDVKKWGDNHKLIVTNPNNWNNSIRPG